MKNNINIVNKYILNHKDEFYEEIGNSIKECRIKKRKVLSDISNNSFITSEYLSRIENGKIGISLLKFVLICNALEINSSSILNNYYYNEFNNEDLLFEELQKDKSINKNIINFMKLKY